MSPLVIDLPFGISVDLSFWIGIFQLGSWEMFKTIFAIIGWEVLAVVFIYMGEIMWLKYRQSMYESHWKWVLLAVDIPEETIQSPKAVEQIFAHLSGALLHTNIAEKYWHGEKQKCFSLEIISIEGYIQFLIHTEAAFRDLVEASIYAQYPQAEITEVEDYVNNIPRKYPNDTHDVFAVEFGLNANETFPIRTYSEFEYSISKDVVFSDPMASLLETFSRVGAGENFWMQIIIEPTGNSWKEKGVELAKKIIEHRGLDISGGHAHNSWASKIGEIPMKLMQELFNIWHWQFEPSEEHAVEVEPLGKMQELTPGLKDAVEAIETKISRVGFKSKIRVLYISRKEIYNPMKLIKAFIGSINQFFNSTRNGIVPKLATQFHYAFKKSRTAHAKNRLVKAYIKRKIKTGINPYILNTEELATVWHFPLPFVKAPLVQKASTKRVEPPINLPLETFEDFPLVIDEDKKDNSDIKADTNRSDKITTDSGSFPNDINYG